MTVWSEGSKQLNVTWLEFRGDAADRLSYEEACVGEPLVEGDEPCVIAVRVEPGEPGTAQLVIHQNLEGPPSFVDIEVDIQSTSSPSPPDQLDLSVSEVSHCLLSSDASNGDSLTILLKIPTAPPSELVPYRISSDTGHAGGGNSSVSNDGVMPVHIGLRSDDFETEHLFKITIDPDGEIAESDEENNNVSVSVTLPAAGEQVQECNKQ